MPAIDVLLHHPVLAVGIRRLEPERRDLLGLLVIVGDVGDQVPVSESESFLNDLFAGRVDEFALWIRERTATQALPFELAARDADLETVRLLAVGKRSMDSQVLQVQQDDASKAVGPLTPS